MAQLSHITGSNQDKKKGGGSGVNKTTRFSTWPKNIVLSVRERKSVAPSFEMKISYTLSGSREYIGPVPLKAALPALVSMHPEMFDVLPSSYNAPRFRSILMAVIKAKCSDWTIGEAKEARLFFKQMWCQLMISRVLLGSSTDAIDRIRIIEIKPIWSTSTKNDHPIKIGEEEVLFNFESKINEMLSMPKFRKMYDDEDGLETYDSQFDEMLHNHCSKKRKTTKSDKLTPNQTHDKNKKNVHHKKSKKIEMDEDEDDDKDNDNKNDEDGDIDINDDNNNRNKNNVRNNDKNKNKKHDDSKQPYVVSEEEHNKWIQAAKLFKCDVSAELIKIVIKHCEGDEDDIMKILFPKRKK